MRRLLFLTIALIVYGSLYPWHFDFSGSGRHPLLVLLNSWPVVWDRFALRDAVINVLLYLPFGAAAVCVLARRFPGWLCVAPALIAAAALSTSMELLQVYIPGRVCSLFDVVCNTTGAGAGAALAIGFGLVRGKRAVGRTASSSGAWLLLIAFAGYQLYPFFPVISLSRLRMAMQILTSMSGFSSYEIWCCAAEWLAVMLIAGSAIEERLPPQILLLALPLRWMVVTRTEALHELLGGILAGVLYAALRRRFRLRAAVWMMASALLLRELAPFHFSSVRIQFNWIPFVPTLVSERQSALVILLRKGFDYGSIVWLLTQSGVSYLRAGVLAAASLAALEAVQCYLPGRTPETTDAVLASMMALILWILENFDRRAGLA